MYYISLFFFILVTFFLCRLSMMTTRDFARLFDIVSFLSIILLSLPLLTITGLLKDFFRSFSIAFSKTCTADKREIKRALHAVKLAGRLILVSGVITTLLGLFSMTFHLDDPSAIGPNVVVAILSSFYALFFYIILLPVRTKLELMKSGCA